MSLPISGALVVLGGDPDSGKGWSGQRSSEACPWACVWDLRLHLVSSKESLLGRHDIS